MFDVLKIRTVLDEASKWDMDYRASRTEVHLHWLSFAELLLPF